MPPELRRERGPPHAAGRLEGVRRRERARQEVERQARVALRFQPLRGGLLDAALQRVVGRRREAVRVAVPVRRSRSSRVRVRVREALVAPDGRGRARARGAGDDARGGREVVPVARELGVPPDALRGRRAEDAPVDGRPAVADPAPRERRARPAAAAAAREEALDEGDLRGVGSSRAVAAAAGGTPRARAVADAAVVRRGHELGDRAVDQRRAGRVAGRGEAVEGLARDDERPVALAGAAREREAPALDARRDEGLERPARERRRRAVVPGEDLAQARARGREPGAAQRRGEGGGVADRARELGGRRRARVDVLRDLRGAARWGRAPVGGGVSAPAATASSRTYWASSKASRKGCGPAGAAGAGDPGAAAAASAPSPSSKNASSSAETARRPGRARRSCAHATKWRSASSTARCDP